MKAMYWYKSLSVNNRIGLKEVAHLICGIKWEDFIRLKFSPKERIQILYDKLKIEGII